MEIMIEVKSFRYPHLLDEKEKMLTLGIKETNTMLMLVQKVLFDT